MTADERSEALKHDVEALGHEAGQAAEKAAWYFSTRVAPVALAALVAVWWIARRRRRRLDQP